MVFFWNIVCYVINMVIRVNIFIIIVFFATILSCSGDKEELSVEIEIQHELNYKDLLIKYDNSDLKDCESLIIAINEMLEVYISIVENAISNEDKFLIADAYELEFFIESFLSENESLRGFCPNEFDAMVNKYKSVIKDNHNLLNELDSKFKLKSEWDDTLRLLENQIDKTLLEIQSKMLNSIINVDTFPPSIYQGTID